MRHVGFSFIGAGAFRRPRAAVAATRLSARVAAIGCGTLIMLASVSLSACSTPSPSAAPSPSPSSTSFSPAGTLSATPGVTHTTTAGAHRPHPGHSGTAPASPGQHHPATPVITAAPATGGGGTAGLQHPLVIWLGAAAIVAGAASMAYRRKLIRNR